MKTPYCRLVRFPGACLVAAVALSACSGLQAPLVPMAPPAPSVAPAAAAAPAAPVAAQPAPPPPPPPPPPTLSYDQAVLSAATTLLKNAQLAPDGTAAKPRYAVVIDPLVDGMTGAQSTATRAMGERLAALIRTQYPQYEVQPFSAANVARSPLVLIGTFTGVNAQRQTAGAREAYRICFALADLKTGKLVSKGLAFSQTDGVDTTPLAYYRDAPAWTEDPATLGYIRTCQGTKAGDPINPMYIERIVAAALVSDAIEAYEAGRYQESLDLYAGAQRTSAGDQFRARVRRQLTGVFAPDWTRPMAETLAALGHEAAWVVHGMGLDELTVAGQNQVTALRDGTITSFRNGKHYGKSYISNGPLTYKAPASSSWPVDRCPNPTRQPSKAWRRSQARCSTRRAGRRTKWISRANASPSSARDLPPSRPSRRLHSRPVN